MLNHPYICLHTNEKLNDDSLKCWIKAVITCSPSGIVTATEIPPNNENLQFYQRYNNDKYLYVGCLSRNLNADEANVIAKKFCELVPDCECQITWSQEPQIDRKHAELSEDVIKAIAYEAARMNHNRWVQQRIDEGWRFSQQHNNRHRTSPLCISWDQLPQSYKRAEYTRVKSLLEVFNQMNLRLVRK